MDYPERDDLLQEVTLKLITAYGFVIKALQQLPLPIEIPAMVDPYLSIDLEATLVRALALLSDIPMDDAHRDHVRGLVIDWMTAADYLFEAEQAFEWWKVEFITTQLQRVTTRWSRILDLHGNQD
ncbi:hypothetical protein [Actinomadura madurae]|uniref:hypothetical protein n=1 Tax=Actinomadura madurae TaxID=1993 RepID=UPI0020D21BB0|nr:hypothetical protein [Actinomadura madurae]MCP9947261.1 hypothetical protein [Actinomadura madurae]MCP9964022.1 hypothetical protein [Actinomadura madurae]MCP9976498.1 hypothetical protein [Actinomadura madurae]MCQ0012007.1 hypothetical protein [Actinomadura madurae]MCQ0012693.1 hypothetical protein [Actinomadura madurae]